jgi:hypothetical protein
MLLNRQPVNEKQDPGSDGRQEVKCQVFQKLPFSIHKLSLAVRYKINPFRVKKFEMIPAGIPCKYTKFGRIENNTFVRLLERGMTLIMST